MAAIKSVATKKSDAKAKVDNQTPKPKLTGVAAKKIVKKAITGKGKAKVQTTKTKRNNQKAISEKPRHLSKKFGLDQEQFTDLLDNDEMAKNAVVALKKFHDSQKGKDALFEDETNAVQMTIIPKKLPTSISMRIDKIRLPYSPRSSETSSICMFVKDLDRDRFNPDVDKDGRAFKDYLLFERNCDPSLLQEVISLRQLKREYKTYESKRKLATAYDLFLVDERVYREVNRNLGKAFQLKKKLPLRVNVESEDVADQIKGCLSSTSCVIRGIGSRALAIDRYVVRVCGKDTNADISLPSGRKEKTKTVEDELTTLDASEWGLDAKAVRVTADGQVTILKQTGGSEVTRKPKWFKKCGQPEKEWLSRIQRKRQKRAERRAAGETKAPPPKAKGKRKRSTKPAAKEAKPVKKEVKQEKRSTKKVKEEVKLETK